MSNHQRLSQAAALHARGDIKGALAEAQAFLRASPADPVALQFVGVLTCQLGDLRLGVDYLRKSIEAGGDTPDNRLNLARALCELGEYAEAEALCAPRSGQPSSPALERMRADIVKAQGRLGEAIWSYQDLVEAEPENFEAWNNLGNVRHDAGDLEGALAALKEAARLQPRSARVHLNLAQVLMTSGRHDDALGLFAEAVRLEPGDATAAIEMGKALQRMGRSKEALVPLADAARIRRTDPDIFVEIGRVFFSLNNLKQAEQSFKVALQVQPRCAPAYLNLAILLEKANRVDELAALLAKAAAAGVKGDDLDYARALLLRRQGGLEEALRLAQASRPESLDGAFRAEFIGEVADRLGDPATAFAAFEEMNRITASYPEASAFYGSEHRLYVDQLAAAAADEMSGWSAARPDPIPPSPAFLVGFLRSGTTLLDTMLMGHPDAHVLEEEPLLARLEEALGGRSLDDLDGETLNRLRALYFEGVQEVAPGVPAKRLLIDKNPLYTLRGPLIQRVFPDARFIFALRHPCDVVLSCFMQNFKVSQMTASFLDLRDAAMLYDRAMAFWEQCRPLFGLNVHTVRYEDLVEDVEGQMRPLLDWLGLPWDPKVLDHQKTAAARGYIRTPSYAQVTEKVYTRASGRWARYRPYLEPVIPILAPWVERYGYRLD
jgi:tetratricopeptide (TPR) repeat protein